MGDSHGDIRSDGAWEKLCDTAIKGAEYNSPERQPHPKCLPGTRVIFLNHAYGLLDDENGSSIVWIHGTAGVGKSAVAFTIADRMKGLEVTAQRPDEKRLAGTFFFSRKHVDRCTTGYFFATLAYQLATNFPSIQDDVIRTVRNNPALLHRNKPLDDQFRALFLQPLQRLHLRIRDCPPLVFVIDALDECTSAAEIADLIFLLGRVLRDPDLPLIHILLTSRSEAHIHRAMDAEAVCPLVREIPVKVDGVDGEAVTSLISLDGADVDSDIYIFLQHSFTELRSASSDFPQPEQHELERLASRAGRRFIVASTMMKFIDDGYNDPYERLQLMLELTNELLPGTEVYKLYDHILSTCADPKRAYLHLSVVATLANPLPISQISELLGPGEGKDVERVLVQLRSVMDIPAEHNLPVNIYHSSIRDYVSGPSNCGLFKEQSIARSPHAILASSSFRLMVRRIPKNTSFLDVLLELDKQRNVMKCHDIHQLSNELVFTVELPTAPGVVMALLWLRGDRNLGLHSWLETRDGRAWLSTEEGYDWLKTQGGLHWVQTRAGWDWLRDPGGKDWLRDPGDQEWLFPVDGRQWLHSQSGWDWLQSEGAGDWLQSSASWWLRSLRGVVWLHSPGGQDWLQSQTARNWVSENSKFWMDLPSGLDWLDSPSGSEWLDSPSGSEWLESANTSLQWWNWLVSSRGRHWLSSPHGETWLLSRSGKAWQETSSAIDFVGFNAREPSSNFPQDGKSWQDNPDDEVWLQSYCGQAWLSTSYGERWLSDHKLPQATVKNVQYEWLDTKCGLRFLRTECGLR